MKKLFSILSILAAASVAYAQTNKFIAVGWNTNNAPIGSIPFVRSATSNGWTAGAPGESYFLSASNNTTPYPHFQPIYGSNIVGGVASAGSSNVFLVVSNLTVTNTWVSANISDSNWTTVASVTADGNPYDIRWDTHMQIKWDGTMDANIRLVTWFTYTDIYGVSTTNFMYDLVPNSDQYLSYHIGSSYTAGGNSRPDIAVNTDYGWTAGSAFFVPKSNTSITITAQRVGSYAGLTTGGATNVANYYFTSIGNGSGSSSSSSGSASNVYFLDSPSISWSQVGGSNYAQVTTSLTNAWRSDINSTSNSITSVMTNLFNTTSNILWASKVTTNTPLTLLSTNQGSSLSNTVDLIAGDSSVTIVTNANKRSFTLTSTGGTSSDFGTNLSPIHLLEATKRNGQSYSPGNFSGPVVTNSQYLLIGAPGTEGVVRELVIVPFYTADSTINSVVNHLRLLVYADSNLTVNVSLAELCGMRYHSTAEDYIVNRQSYYANTYVETTNIYAAGPLYQMYLKFPMPFTNGCWARITNTIGGSNWVQGYMTAYVDRTPIPTALRDYRMYCYSTNKALSGAASNFWTTVTGTGQIIGMAFGLTNLNPTGVAEFEDSGGFGFWLNNAVQWEPDGMDDFFHATIGGIAGREFIGNDVGVTRFQYDGVNPSIQEGYRWMPNDSINFTNGFTFYTDGGVADEAYFNLWYYRKP